MATLHSQDISGQIFSSTDHLSSLPADSELAFPTTQLDRSTTTNTFSSKKPETLQKYSPHKATKKTLEKERKRKWPEGKPKRPLSAYNYFFRHERERIIKIKYSTADSIPKNRRHGLTTGTGFGGLARSVAEKWKNMDKVERSIFQAQADNDKLRYKAAVEAWKTERKLAQIGSVTNAMLSCTTAAAANPTTSMSLSEPSLDQGLDNLVVLARCDRIEQMIGKMILNMHHQNKELSQQVLTRSDNNNNVVIVSSNDAKTSDAGTSQANHNNLNLNEIHLESFEPTPITSLTTSVDTATSPDCATVRTSNSDTIVKSTTFADLSTSREQTNSFDSNIFGMNEDIENTELLQLETTIENVDDIFDSSNADNIEFIIGSDDDIFDSSDVDNIELMDLLQQEF